METLQHAQAYEAQAWWTADKIRTEFAEYRFTSADGPQGIVHNQKINGGQWMSLGVHTLNQGTLDITLGNKVYGVLSADAVRIIPLYTQTDTYYYHNDHLGTPQLLTNQTQEVVWHANYSTFGEATLTREDITNNLRFAGQYFDGETGLHYNWHRYYDCLLYTSPSPRDRG